MEAHANSVEDRLIDGLSFKLSPGASYIQERKSVSFHPQGSNIYSTNGTKLIKLLVSGDSWMDPSTFRVMFDLLNTPTGGDAATKELRPLGGPHTIFRRMRVLCGGQVVEDIDNYNRVHQMFSVLSAKDSRGNVDVEAFGREWNVNENLKSAYSADTFPGIKADEFQTVLFKPLSGLLNQPKYLPIRYCPLTIELELVDDETEPIVPIGGSFSGANTSEEWQIQNVQAKCDMCTLDNALDNSYAEHLLSGKALPINYNTYVSQMQSVASGQIGNVVLGQQDVRLNVTRSLTRLKSVFVSLFKSVNDLGSKQWNNFYSPMHAEAITNNKNQFSKNGEFHAQLQLGSKLFPEYPIRSHAEAYYQLRKTLGIQSSNLHNFDIDSFAYRTNKFVWATDMERVLEAGFTGQNTRAGDILNISFKYNDATQTRPATSVHIVLNSDNIIEIRDNGIQVFD